MRLGRIRVQPNGMRYFLLAMDASDGLNPACLPEGCEADAWSFEVEP